MATTIYVAFVRIMAWSARQISFPEPSPTGRLRRIYRKHFQKGFDFLTFNLHIVDQYLSQDTGTPASEKYETPFHFEGELIKLTIDI